MKIQNEHINLIIKHFAQEASEGEEQILQNWLSEDANHQQIFDDYKKIWSFSEQKNIPEIEVINVDAEWQKFKKEIAFETENRSVKSAKSFSLMRIAAVILVFISLGIAGMYLFNNKEQRIVASNELIEAKLPDNTEVTVNKNSELIYDKKYNKKERKVKLKGEAFFKVSKDKTKPFIIKTESFYVEVLGTQFYVNSDFKNRQVVVKEGTVAVYQYEDKHDKVILNAGDKIIFNKHDNQLRKIENQDENYMSWKTKIFNFNNRTLEDVAAELENIYDVKFKFVNPDLKKCRISAGFKNQSIVEIINVLQATFETLTFRKEGNKIIVGGKSCK
ncbi:MAG: FecR domain-containing protein [Bacteroidales bacterium]|nr:FecR domain-containing protein [Bacteroidales bacterium]